MPERLTQQISRIELVPVQRRVPRIDPETGAQLLDEDGQPVLDTIEELVETIVTRTEPLDPADEAAMRAEWAREAANRPQPRYVDPSAIVSRLTPYAAAIKAAVESDPRLWMLWQRMVGRSKPIDMDDPEFPGAWQLLADVIGPAGADPAKLLAEIRAEAR